MTAFFTTLWAIIKWAAIVGGSFALVVLCIVIFHPIYFTLCGRASVKGQRGEVKVSYLFNIIRIRYIASAHTQDVWLEVFKWRKLLQRETREKEHDFSNIKSEKKPFDDIEKTEDATKSDSSESKELQKIVSELQQNEDIKTADVTTADVTTEELVEERITKENESSEMKKDISEELNDKKEEEKTSESDAKVSQEEIKKEDSVEELAKEPTDTSADSVVSDSDNVTIDEGEPEYKVEATPEQLAELQSILEAEEKKEEEKVKAKKDDWQAKLRKFKKDFNRRYDDLRGKFRLVRQKWNSLWPVAKRFWNRGKKGFRFHDASLMIKYSLDEHYLTGMLCGYIAPTIGMAKQYGVDWRPIPVFPEKNGAGIYSKMAWHIDIRPHMLVWAVICLFFEKNIYKEIYWFYKYKKEKKAKKNSTK